jgi:hypothetical protein
MQVDRQKEVQKDVQIYIQTNRNKDVQTYTDKQTDRGQCKSAGTG